MVKTIYTKTYKILVTTVVIAALLVAILYPATANAALLTARKVELGNSAAGATTTHKFDYTIATTASIGSIKYEYCTTASGACTLPTGLNTSSATVTAQTGSTGYTMTNTTNGAPYLSKTAVSLTATTQVSHTLGAIVNPSTTNTTFYVRITTYTSTNATTGATDNGTVATSTANQITVTANVDETLTFCVYTGGSCGAGGSTSALGTLSPSSTASATSKFDVGTNSSSGYNVTYTGTVLTSGSNTITAMGTQTANGAAAASSIGGTQFGMNLRDNATPNVGTDKTGGAGDYGTNYGTVDSFRFLTGDTVATATGPSNSTTFTVSYIANIGAAQAAGAYTTTLTYICTATY